MMGHLPIRFMKIDVDGQRHFFSQVFFKGNTTLRILVASRLHIGYCRNLAFRVVELQTS